MRRRALLHALGSGLALGSADLASGHPTATGDGTPPAETPDSQPLGMVGIDDTREMVLDEAGERAYVATQDGFAVVDVSDPADMAVLAEETVLADHDDGPLTGIWDLNLDGDRLLVVGPAYGGVPLRGFGYFDVSDPSDPELVAEHETEVFVHNCYLADGVAYVTGGGYEGSPLVVLDPETGEELSRWSVYEADDRWADLPFGMVNLHDVWVHGDLAYLAYWDAGTWCLDVSDPAAPELVSRVRGRPLEELLDVQNPSIERTERPGNDHFVTVDESGDLLGIGTEAWAVGGDSEGAPGGIDFYDVSDPTDPTRLGGIDPPPTTDATRGGVWTTAHNFELVDGRCYAAWYQGGVTVHDLSDPTAPVERYRWRDADRGKFWTSHLAAPGEYFVAASVGAFGSNADPDESPLAAGLFAFPDPATSTATPTADPVTGGEPTPTNGTGPGTGVVGGVAGLLGVGAWLRRRSE